MLIIGIMNIFIALFMISSLLISEKNRNLFFVSILFGNIFFAVLNIGTGLSQAGVVQ